jgi:hypothetical protein
MRTSPYLVGVIAGPNTGFAIDRVEFSVNGGAATSVTEMTLATDSTGNPAWAFWHSLTSGAHADSTTAVTVDATAYDTNGNSRVLPQIKLWPDFGGTITDDAWIDPVGGNDSTGEINNSSLPFATLIGVYTELGGAGAAGMTGVRVFLRAGAYDWSATQVGGVFASGAKPFEACADTGVARASITITGGTAGANCYGNVIIRGVTLDPSAGPIFHAYGGVPAIISLVDVAVPGEGSADADPATAIDTNGATTRYYGAAFTTCKGIGTATAYRNVTVADVSGDIFTGASLIYNCSVTDHIQVGAQHADLFQTIGAGGVDNVILCNVRSTNSATQNIFLGDGGNALTNSWFCNVDIDFTSTVALSEVGTVNSGVLFEFITIKGQQFYFNANSAGTPADSQIRGCVLHELASTYNAAGFAAEFNADDNHLINTAGVLGTGIGDNNTSGAAGWNATTRIPNDAGNLAGRIADTDPIWIPFDADNNERAASTAIGARAAVAEYSEADVTPPTASGWATNTDGDEITATLSESGCTPAIGTGGFSLSVGSATVSSWAISGTTLTLTLSGTIYAGQTVEVSYDNAGASEAIADASDNLLADITDADVTNNSTVEPAEGTAGALIGAFGFGFGF